jgi:hypothetical protein
MYTTFPTVQEITLSTTVATGSIFLGWSGDCAGTSSCTAVMNANHNVTATFATVSTTGSMTGGGHVVMVNGTRVTSGMTLKCTASTKPQNLEINWDKGNKFKLDGVSSVACYDDAAISPNPPTAGFDTIIGSGTGKLNGELAMIEWKFVDAGEPGVKDTMSIIIRQDGLVAISVSGPLNGGNYQAHK